MEAANKVISRLPDRGITKAKPVIRHGEKVRIFEKGDLKGIASAIGEEIHQMKASYKSIAVICKTTEECKSMLAHLKKDIEEIHIISGKDEVYRSGVVIVPSYLAKGLEFDVVMIANASGDVYKEEELDIKLLYVAMTRALHKLHIYSCGKSSPLLEGV